MKKITLLFIMLTAYFGYAQPTDNAASPTKMAANVISIYSDAYTDTATNYNPGWGQSGTVNSAYDPGTGDLVMEYANFNYQGTEITTVDASAMEYLHVDIWTSDATNVKVSPINNGTGAGEALVDVVLVTNGWSSVDIPKSSFTSMTWDAIYQLKFDGQGGVSPSTIYLDNIYFWKEVIDPQTDATLSDLTVDGTTIASFSASTLTYNYPVPGGTTTVPSVLATARQAGATVNITAATVIPDSTTIEVTAMDGTTTKTYTVNFVEVGPGTAAPTPPARLATDVVSIYSDAYAGISGINLDAGWCGANSIEAISPGGDSALAFKGNPCQGIDFDANRQDITDFTHIHVDFYIETGTDLVGKVFNLKAVYDVGEQEINIDINGLSPAPVPGEWYSYDVAVAYNATTLRQFAVTSNLNNSVWYDNLYLHKNTTLGTKNFEIAGLNAHPNPTQDSWIVKTQNIKITSIEVFDILGKNVMSLKPEASEATINASQLKSGLYFAKINTANGSSNLKLVRQ